MLLQFNFKNFKSFRDDTTLDMTATKITEFEHHVIRNGNEKVLPVAAIFGANASGKSNVLEAFRFMAVYVVRSFGFGDERKKKGKDGFLLPPPFLFDINSKKEPSLFEVFFTVDEQKGLKTYNYGFTVGRKGIEEEWLNSKSKSSRSGFKRIFYRDGDELDLPGISEKSRENIKIALEKEVLVVSLGAKLKIGKLKLIRDWFFDNEIADFGSPEENFLLSSLLPGNFTESKEVQDQVVRYLSAFDESIVGFEVEKIGEDDKKQTRLRIFTAHKVIGSNKTATIPLEFESAGTLKMFALYPLLKEVLERGSVLFVDELNARLHPLLMRAFIINFLNPETNPNHAQLVFTTHDSWQLNNNLLRRDEVWFTEKTTDGVSTLYSLADFVDEDGLKIRKDENYEKNYLLGKYGAIPLLQNFDILGG